MTHKPTRLPFQVALAAILLCSCAPSPRQIASKHERDYQQDWCAEMHGRTEVILADNTRVDCLTSEYAVEVEFAPKWAEAIGQSLYYAQATGKRPGVLLIMRPADQRYLSRLQAVATDSGLTVWTVER